MQTLKCPNCGSEGPSNAPDEVFHQRFYKLKHTGYFVCLQCTRRFSTATNIRVS